MDATRLTATHDVTNQAPPLQDYDVFGSDAVLVEAVDREGAAWAADDLHALGHLAGQPTTQAWAGAVEHSPPVLHTHDRYGHRVDEVSFHPAYHSLLAVGVHHGLHASPWGRVAGTGEHVARAAGFLVWSQVDAGIGCPLSMTYASVGALRHSPDLLADWLPGLTSHRYDQAAHAPSEKLGSGSAVLVGMAMTEKQGGSDVRANTTRALDSGARADEAGGGWRLTGHKWFCSAPMSDAFLVLAQAEAGLSCFLLPRVTPDGVSAIRLQRLKDKLGNRSNASAEIELDDAPAFLIGEPGRGVATIAAMVSLTRLDCVLGTAALVRQGVAQAIHHATYRRAFGRLLVDAPLMQAVLADLAVESEAATLLALRLAGAVDRSEPAPGNGAAVAGNAAAVAGNAAAGAGDEHESLLRRIGTAVGKYYVCKRGPHLLAEALECLGGNGYVEDSGMPRLYREAPVNSIWEGSGNVNALDVLRALDREPQTADALLAEVDAAAGADARLDAFRAALADDLDAAVRSLRADPAGRDQAERGARRLVERMALALQGSLVVRHSPAAVADAFCASRLAGDWGSTVGTLPGQVDVRAIIDRHAPRG